MMVPSPGEPSRGSDWDWIRVSWVLHHHRWSSDLVPAAALVDIQAEASCPTVKWTCWRIVRTVRSQF